jgi:hypothetical protein
MIFRLALIRFSWLPRMDRVGGIGLHLHLFALSCGDNVVDSRILSIPVRVGRALLAAIFFVCGMLPGTSCCCGSRCGDLSQGERSCCNSESDCSCCCRQSGNPNTSGDACCFSKQSEDTGATTTTDCCCLVSPVTYGIVDGVAQPDTKQDLSVWQNAIATAVDFTKPPATERLRSNVENRRDPCAHNLRQAILCVWRN